MPLRLSATRRCHGFDVVCEVRAGSGSNYCSRSFVTWARAKRVVDRDGAPNTFVAGANHPVQSYLNIARNLQSDAVLVDTFPARPRTQLTQWMTASTLSLRPDWCFRGGSRRRLLPARLVRGPTRFIGR